MRLLLIGLAALAIATTPARTQELEIPESGYVVSHDLSLLPEAVQARVAELKAIAASGDVEALRPILEGDHTTVSFGGPDDATAYLKDASADKQGVELLALMADLLEAPFAAMDGGDGDPVYVWPHLAAYDQGFADLSAADRVVAYQIMGYEAFEEMKPLDAWYYWRLYIEPHGNLSAFVAGD
jgi:hypothetical protein